MLDGLLASGLALEDHRSCSSWTYPSVMCALSGRDNLDIGYMPQADRMSSASVPDDTLTLGSWLGARGGRPRALARRRGGDGHRRDQRPGDRAHMADGFTTQSVELDGWRLMYRWDGRLSLYDREVGGDPDTPLTRTYRRTLMWPMFQVFAPWLCR